MKNLDRMIKHLVIPVICVAAVVVAVRLLTLRQYNVDHTTPGLEENIPTLGEDYANISLDEVTPQAFSEDVRSAQGTLRASLGEEPSSEQLDRLKEMEGSIDAGLEELQTAEGTDWEAKRADMLSQLQEYAQLIAEIRSEFES